MLGEGRVSMLIHQWLATLPYIAISLITRGISHLGNGPRPAPHRPRRHRMPSGPEAPLSDVPVGGEAPVDDQDCAAHERGIG